METGSYRSCHWIEWSLWIPFSESLCKCSLYCWKPHSGSLYRAIQAASISLILEPESLTVQDTLICAMIPTTTISWVNSVQKPATDVLVHQQPVSLSIKFQNCFVYLLIRPLFRMSGPRQSKDRRFRLREISILLQTASVWATDEGAVPENLRILYLMSFCRRWNSGIGKLWFSNISWWIVAFSLLMPINYCDCNNSWSSLCGGPQ